MTRIPATVGSGGAFYPFVGVDVRLPAGLAPRVFTALVDSGADRTVVPRFVIDALGVDHRTLPILADERGTPLKGEGADGRFEIRICRGSVRWQGVTICEEFWVTNAPVVLLGRADFFRRFDVFFDWSATLPYMDIEPAGSARALGSMSN